MYNTEQLPNVVMSAPNQNRDNFDHRLERFVPYFAARFLNRAISASFGSQPLSIDMWNSFGHLMDKDYKKQTRFDGATREEYSSLLLDEKYRFLEGIGIDTTQIEVFRDDDADTTNWMQRKLTSLLEAETIYEDIESVCVCVSCDNIIAVASSNASACGRCESADIRVEKRKTLFLDLPGDRLGYVRGKILLPKKANFINSQFATLPGRVMIARSRDYGQDLGISGYEDKVLDPKIGLGLMPEMIAERYDIGTVTQVQGATTAKNTVPYTSVLTPDLKACYIFTGNIPAGITPKQLEELGAGFFTKYLASYMLDRVGNVDETQMQSLRKEHSKAKRKAEHAINYLQMHVGDGKSATPKNLTQLTEAIDSMAAYDVRRGVLAMRKFIFDQLGGQYVADLREHKQGTQSADIRTIAKLLEEVI